MFVPDLIRDSVLFLGTKDPKTGKFIPRATAFLVATREGGLEFRHIVTAEHSVASFQQKGWDMWIRSNTISGGVQENNWKDCHWYFHPDESKRTDIAVSTIDFEPEEKWKTILIREENTPPEKTMAATSEVLEYRKWGLGNEVFLVGLFRSHFGRQKNVPIVRIGNIAMMQGEPVWTQWCGFTDAYLIEARSINGLSGSPVFIHGPTVGYTGNAVYLLGLMHGHFDIENLNEDIVTDDIAKQSSGINTGVGVVIPVEKILETIDHPELVEMRKKLIREHREQHGATSDFSAGDPPANDENPTHREDFMRLLDAAAQKPQQEG